MSATLDLRPAFAVYGQGMTPAQHLEHYGRDLAWIQTRAGHITCRACAAGVELPGAAALAAVICAVFIENHAGCVRVRKPKREVA